MPRQGSHRRARRLGAAVLLVAALAPAGTATAERHASSGRAPDYFGIDARRAGAAAVPADAARQGVRVVRTTIRWSDVEPLAPGSEGHVYDWHVTDVVVAGLAQAGLEMQPVLEDGASWTHGSGFPAHFGAFAAAIAHRYGPSGTFWSARPDLTPTPVRHIEVGHEPNVAPLSPVVATPAAYADVFVAASERVQAAEPQVDVVIGALSEIRPLPFLQNMLAHRPDAAARITDVAFGVASPAGADDAIARIKLFRRSLNGIRLRDTTIDLVTDASAATLADVAADDRFIKQGVARLLPDAAGVPAAWTAYRDGLTAVSSSTSSR